MPSILQSPWYRKVVIALVVLLSPLITVLLAGGAVTADVGAVGWILIVFVPLALLGVGIYLIAIGGASGTVSENDVTE